MNIDENSIIQNKGFEAKPLGWFHDLEYMKKGSVGSATVNIDFEYTPDNTTVEEINMNCNLMEDNSLTEITDMCNLAKLLYPYEMLESLETQTLDLIQQYKTTQEEQHISYIVSDTQYSVSVNNTETENCDYSLGIRIFYFGDGSQSSF